MEVEQCNPACLAKGPLMTHCLQHRAHEARGLEHREQAGRQAEMGTEPFLSTLHSVWWERKGSLCISRNASTDFLRDKM